MQYFGSNNVEGVEESWVEVDMNWVEVDGTGWRWIWVHGLAIPIALDSFQVENKMNKKIYNFHFLSYRLNFLLKNVICSNVNFIMAGDIYLLRVKILL